MIFCITGILSCIIFCAVGYRIEKRRIMNLMSIFFIEWSVILLFSSMQLWTLVLPDDSIYAMIFIGLCSFFIGYTIFKVFPRKKRLKTGIRSDYTTYHFVLRYKIVYILASLTIIFYILWAYNVFKQVSLFNLYSIISIQRSEDFIGMDSKVLNALSIFVFRPFKIALPAIAATDYWFGKRDRILFSLNIILLVIGLFSNGGRTSVLNFGIYFTICALVYLSKTSKLSSKLLPKKKLNINKRRVRNIIVITIVAFVVMTISRGFGGYVAILQNIYIAFAIQPRMFEIWGEYVTEQHIVGFGCASLFGFIYPFFYLIKNLLGIPLPELINDLFDCIGLTETQWVWPGTGMRNNAYVSPFWYLYTDARLIGIIVGMFLIGLYAANRQNCLYNSKFNVKNMTLYCLSTYLIVFSFVRLQFGIYQFALATVYASLIVYKRVKLTTRNRWREYENIRRMRLFTHRRNKNSSSNG